MSRHPVITRRTFLGRAVSGATALAVGRIPAGAAAAPAEGACDVLVYGATPGGIAAAVAAARSGRTVILAAHEDHIGGIVSNGLTNADIGKKQAVGGLFHEFTRRVVAYYEAFDRDDPAKPNVKLCRNGYWYEASVAERVFREMLDGEGGRIRLLLGHELRAAVVVAGRLSAAVFADAASPGRPLRIAAAAFVDATYEGDLAAMAGAPYRVGRESRDEYGEPHAGRIYTRFGTREPLEGSTGVADDAIQGFCFRFHVTKDPARRVPIAKPAAFNRDDYRHVLEDLASGRASFRDVVQVYPMPNGKFETNSNHPHPVRRVPSESFDLAEENWGWPEATPAARRRIYERYLAHNTGLMWLLQNDPAVPEAVRTEAAAYGWPRDEWAGNGHVPRQVYVRQGRRILGDHVLTQRDGDPDPALERTPVRRDSIGILEFAFDSHGCHKYDPAHPGVREGYIYIEHPPLQVPYGVIVPRGVDGLLVPVACSCSHVGYNALRMEPVFMALGEAAGIAAHVAIARGTTVRAVPVAEVQGILVSRRGVITFYSDLPFDHPRFAALQWLGARGLNPRYDATPDLAMTRRHGWTKLARILAAEGRAWTPPSDRPEAPLTAADLDAWLRAAGMAVPAGPADPATLAGFAERVFAAMGVAMGA